MKKIFLLLVLTGLALNSFASERETPVVKAVKSVQDAVVNIRTETVKRRQSLFNDPFWDEFMGFGGTYTSQSLGTGVLIDANGTIVTNYHVVSDATNIAIIGPDGSQIKARLIGGDSLLDLAILKLDGVSGLPYAVTGTSADIMPGETVIAIGNPYGLNSSVTIGVVSNIRRIIKVGDSFSVFIQTDALINPGNSGGPLINLDGEVIGINSAIYKDAQGIGFAIPIDAVKRVIPELIRYQKIRRGYPGFTFDAGSAGVEQGLVISSVTAGNAAERQGIRRGDVLEKLDGLPVSSIASVNYVLRTFPPGQQLDMELKRGDRLYTASVMLSEYPVNYGVGLLSSRYGIDLNESRGSLVVRGSRYPQYIREGDVLLAINNTEMHSLGDVDAIMTDAAYEEIRLRISSNRRVFEIRLKP